MLDQLGHAMWLVIVHAALIVWPFVGAMIGGLVLLAVGARILTRVMEGDE